MPSPDPGYVQHTINVVHPLEARIRRCMTLEGQRIFTEFASAALARRCREIEQFHGLDADGKPLPPGAR